TMKQVREIMDGSSKENRYQIVFDDANSSTYRYVLDSINLGKPLPSSARAAKGSENVVNYVAQNKNAIGVIGVSWISDPADSLGFSFLQKIRVVAIKGDGEVDYFKPYQAYIALKSYPLTRAFYFILREAYSGLGTGFANFLGGNAGQLIIGKYRLFPARLDIVFRKATIQ
ncbi:MAG: PstS family phosphate ABC transporter substrate-binding protein, partial [Chitinophagaceae bacterium]